MTPQIGIVFNPRSGKAPEPAAFDDALRRAGLDARIHRFEDVANPAEWLAAVARAHTILVAAGGDGTVSSVAAAALETDRTFGVIPTGTLNHFARDAGIPVELDAACATLASGQTRPFDVARANGATFLNNASIGAYPQMVRDRARVERHGVPRPIAAALATLRTWLALRPLTIRILLDGTPLVRRTPFLVIGNGEYAIEGMALGTRRAMNDGQLSLYAAPGGGRWDMLLMPARALWGTLEQHEKFEVLRGREVVLTPRRRGRVNVGLDGEVTPLDPPIRFDVRRHVLRVLVPQASGGP